MAEIVNFPARGPRNSGDDERDDVIAKFNAESEKQKLRVLKANLEERPRMPKPSERATVAVNLGRLLERLEGEGIKKSSVAKAWRPGSETDSTKRLYTYVLPQDLPKDESTRRASQLAQKVSGYRELAEHAAKLAGKSADSFFAEIFHGTGYESHGNDLPDELNAPWVRYMRDLLLKMCDWTARRNELAGYFQKIENEMLSVGNNGESWGETFVRHTGDQYLARLKRGVLLHHSYIGDCIPSILLSRKELQCIRGEMQISEKCKDGVKPPHQSDECSKPCEIVTYLELYLSVAPLGPDRAPQGVFEFRIMTDVRTNQGFDVTKVTSFEDYLDEVYGGPSKSLDEWRLVWQTEEDDDLNEVNIPLWVRAVSQEVISWKHGSSMPVVERVRPQDVKIIHDPQIEVSGCRLFGEIDLASVYEFLGRDYLPEETWIENECEPWQFGLDDFADETPAVSSPRTLAHLIENNLYVSEGASRLDNLLDKRASFLANAVRNYMHERNDRLAKLKADTLNRYD